MAKDDEKRFFDWPEVSQRMINELFDFRIVYMNQLCKRFENQKAHWRFHQRDILFNISSLWRLVSTKTLPMLWACVTSFKTWFVSLTWNQVYFDKGGGRGGGLKNYVLLITLEYVKWLTTPVNFNPGYTYIIYFKLNQLFSDSAVILI